MNKDVLPGGSDQTVTRGTDGRKISRGTHKQILCGGGIGWAFFCYRTFLARSDGNTRAGEKIFKLI